MNLNDTPTLEQFRDLLRHADDHAGHHVLWVKKDGSVQLAVLPRGPRRHAPTYDHPDMQMRYDTFPVGYEYVGEDAANDDWWTPLLFKNLLENWERSTGKSQLTHIDLNTVAPDGRPVDAEERAQILRFKEESERREKRIPVEVPRADYRDVCSHESLP